MVACESCGVSLLPMHVEQWPFLVLLLSVNAITFTYFPVIFFCFFLPSLSLPVANKTNQGPTTPGSNPTSPRSSVTSVVSPILEGGGEIVRECPFCALVIYVSLYYNVPTSKVEYGLSRCLAVCRCYI